MKSIVLFAFCMAITMIACHGQKSDQSQPPVVTASPTPSPTPVVLPTPPPIPQAPAYCSPVGAHFQCGNPVWWHQPVCSATNDGTVYLKDLNDMADFVAKANAGKDAAQVETNYAMVKMLDGSTKYVGNSGWYIPCNELAPQSPMMHLQSFISKKAQVLEKEYCKKSKSQVICKFVKF